MSIKSNAIHEEIRGEVYTQKEFEAEYGLDGGVAEDEYAGAQVFDGEKLVSPEEYKAAQSGNDVKGA